MKILHQADANTKAIQQWLHGSEDNQARLIAWLNDHGGGESTAASLYGEETAELRERIVKHFELNNETKG